MWGIIRWMNPFYAVPKAITPLLRRPEKTLALAGKPIASASALLMERNKETLTIPITGDVQGEATVTVPYDQETLEKILAVSLLPQVMLLQSAYAIPEIRAEIDLLWRTLRGSQAGRLPAWNGVRGLLSTRAREAAAQRYAARYVAARGGGQIVASAGARAGASFVAGLNIIVWVDTAILAATGLLDLLIDEETEDQLGVNITPFSPIGEVINGLLIWVGGQLGVTSSDLIRVGESMGLDTLAKAGLFATGDIVLDLERTEIAVELEDRIIDLNLDARTLGAVMGEALQISALEASLASSWDDREEMIRMFLLIGFSFVIIIFARQLWRLFRT
jgi:hypothetical protein